MRVLVVEDEPRLGEYLERGLRREGMAVDLAKDGESGLWLATTAPYDVIVLDIMLPKMNGFRVCAELRRREVWIPILMLTAKDGELDEAEALDTGADDFLSKPFSLVVLLARLRALARRVQAHRPAMLAVGRLELDPATRRCRVQSVEVMLTATEFNVLHLLLCRAGDVVSKAEILAACWDWAFEGDPNIVEVYIRRLRRKLEDASAPGAIETVRGAGYRIAVDEV